MLTDITDKIQERITLHPVIVVHQLSGIRSVGVKIKELSQLFLDAILIVTKSSLVQQITLGRLHRRVTDHTGSATH